MKALAWLPFAAVLSLTGCGPSGKSADADNAAPRPAAQAAPAPSGPLSYPASDYSEQAPGKPGGTLRVSMATDTGTLDFHTISSTNAQFLGRILYDNLVYLDEKGNISPWLAKSWEISPDGKTYTFHLRDDVTFSDGAKFNAEALRVNLEHMRDPATKSPLAARYIEPYVSGKVLDEYTFQATLKEPYAPFLYVLAQAWLSIESPKAILADPKALNEHPVGSGPFVLESYAKQQGVKFVRRPDYHWAPQVVHHEGPAYLDRIEIEFVPEAMIRYNSLAAGQYDLTTDAPLQNAAAIQGDGSLVLSSRVRLGNPLRGIVFNTTKPPFNDVRLRKAIALAIDREGIVQMIGFGVLRPKTDYLSATTPYYDPSFQDVLKYDVAAANRLLDEAGWTGRDGEGYRTKDGARLSAEVLVREAGTPSPTLIAIQDDVKKVGVEFHLTQLPSAQLLARRNANEYQVMSDGVWHTNTPDGLFIVYDSKQISSETRTGQNTARLQDAVLDGLLERARQSTDPVLLKDLYSQAQKRLTELVPTVPLYENQSSIAYHSYVKGVIFDTSHEVPVFTALWLDGGSR